MKNKTLSRIICTALALTMAFALAGCGLNKDNADKNEKIVIAKVGDKNITYGEVDALYQMYVQQFKGYGYDLESDPDTANMYKAYIVNDFVEAAVQLYQAKQQGFDKLSDDQQKQLDQNIQEAKDDVREFYRDQAEEEQAQDVDARVEELIKLEADNYYPGENLTPDQYLERVAEDTRDEYYKNLLRESVLQGVSVTDEDVKAWYDESIAQQEEEYKEDPAFFEGDYEAYVKASDMPVVYQPAGYGKFLHILIGPDSDVTEEHTKNKTQLDNLAKEAGSLYLSGEDNERLAQIKTEYDALSATVKQVEDGLYLKALEKIKEAYAKLESGIPFGEVMQEYTEDSNFLGETSYAAKGMLIFDDSDTISDEVKAKYKALEAGKYSEYFLDEDGYHILYNMGTVAEGAVDFDTVKDDIQVFLLNEKQTKEWDACLAAWAADKSVTIFADRLEQLGVNMSVLAEG